MKDEWLKDIRDRMADYETAEPDGLWESIEANMPPMPAAKGKKSAPVVLLWTKRLCAAAAVVAIVVLLGGYLGGQLQQQAQPERTPLAANDGTQRQPEVVLPADLEAEPVKRLAQATTTSNVVTLPLMATVAEESKEKEEPEEAATPTVGSHDAEPSDNSGTKQKERPTTNSSHAVLPPSYDYYVRRHRTRNDDSRLRVGTMAAGGIGSSQMSSRTGEAFVSAINPAADPFADDALLGILLYNQGKEVTTEARHKLPVRAGVTVSYQLNDRVSLESGLTYTKLSSDVTEGTDSHYFTADQTLQYVGIPANVKYKVASAGPVDFYASAGALVEKCVSAKQKKDYVLENVRQRTVTESLHEKPLQLSMNASAGVQLNISPTVGVYAEPGVSYYFDDGSEISTIYKEKPVNFNLNVGLRVSLGK